MSPTEQFKKSLYGRPSTVKTKISIFENHIIPYIHGKRDCNMLIDAACNGWREDQLSLGTIKSCFVLLAEYVSFAYSIKIDKKRLHYEYFSDLTKAPQRVKIWTKQQVNVALLNAQRTDLELYKLMRIALGTGMRRGEIFGLKWTDVNFFDSTITVCRSLDISSGAIGPTKTKQTRTIQMSDVVAKILEMCYNVGDTGYCFPNYFDPNSRLEKVAKSTEIPIITFHGLRHTFATTCLENKMSPKWVSSTLGHAKLTTTIDLYWQNFQEKVNMEKIYE